MFDQQGLYVLNVGQLPVLMGQGLFPNSGLGKIEGERSLGKYWGNQGRKPSQDLGGGAGGRNELSFGHGCGNWRPVEVLTIWEKTDNVGGGVLINTLAMGVDMMPGMRKDFRAQEEAALFRTKPE